VVVSSIGTTSTFPDGFPSAADELLVEDFWVDVPLEAADFSADGEAADAALESAELPAESSWPDVSPDEVELLVGLDWEVPHPASEQANTRAMIAAPAHASFNRAMFSSSTSSLTIGFAVFSNSRW